MKSVSRIFQVIAFVVVGFVDIHLALAADASPKAEKVFFKNLKDGQEITSPFTIEMGAQGVTVAPAGEVKPGQGHHHLIIDGGPVKEGETIAADATHLHFGKAQTEAPITLTPGKHTLTLQFADGMHKSYGPKLSSTVHVEVKG